MEKTPALYTNIQYQGNFNIPNYKSTNNNVFSNNIGINN